MSRIKWWQWAVIGLFGITIVSVVATPPQSAVDTEPGTTPGRILSTRTVDYGRAVHAMVVEPAAPAASLEARARDLCGDAPMCDVMAWEDPSLVARAWPMTEREAQGVVYSYKLNRSNGYEASAWNCNLFPDAPSDRCMN